MLGSCICSTLVSVCAMKGIPIGPLAQWGKDLTYYFTPFFCLINWDIYYPGSACRGTDLPPDRILYIHCFTQDYFSRKKRNLSNTYAGHCVKWYTVTSAYEIHLILISLSKFNLPLIGSFYVTHAARALQCHNLSEEGIKRGITDILFWPNNDMEGFPGWMISPMPGPPPRQHKHERQYTPSTHPFIPTRRIWNEDYGGQMIFGDLVGLKFPEICLTGEERKPHPGNRWT